MVVSPAVCSACGESLGTTDICLACLLRVGLDEAGASGDSNGPTVFGDFEIERREDGSLWELGRGAMGVTYRAADKVLHRTVALKVIEAPAAASDSKAVRERFLREARAAAALRHPNIAGVFHFGASPEIDRCYCAMELVEGETLEARVRREGPLKLDVALEVALQVTHALAAAAAERGLVHRDLKPGNIMLAHGGDPARLEVKVIDFGLAKAASNVAGEMELTHGGFVGTPAFASPEQFAGDAVDARSDIYALGVTLWLALTGRLPFIGKTIEEIRTQQALQTLPWEHLKARTVPEAVIDLLRTCLALDPAKRPGSPGELMQAIESCRDQSAKRAWRRNLRPFILGVAILTAILSAFLLLRPNGVTTDQSAVSAPPIEKSIAVLPFENLSADRDDAFFADSIQDDVLTSVGKVKGLKVIARASVMDYRGARLAGKVREIGQTLGVSHVLEGSVRRMGDRVVLNVALIDTRNERRVWAERYERTITDAISLQGELAIEIARALQTTLTPAEATVVAAKATQNPEAYLLYLRAREIEIRSSTAEKAKAAAQLYQQAVDLDPSFAVARARLSLCVNRVFDYEPTPAGKAKARAEAEEALRLQPQLGEARLALTHCYLWGDRDYDRALRELARAAQLLPNSAEVPLTAAYIYKRQNRYRDRVAALQRAEVLDPRNCRVLGLLACTQRWLRDWPEALHRYDRYAAVSSSSSDKTVYEWWWYRASDEFRLTSDINALKKAIKKEADGPPSVSVDWLNVARYETALLERDYIAAAQFLSAIPLKTFSEALSRREGHSKAFHEALLAVADNREAAARREALDVARIETETRLSSGPYSADDEKAHADLALLYAFLGCKEDAVRAALRAVEIQPAETTERNDISSALAMVYAHTGELEKAIDLIEHLLTVPTELQRGAVYNMTLTDLKWRWQWDPLRSHPRFQTLLASPEPKTVY